MADLKRCTVCGGYTLQDTHCDADAISPHPARFSPEDRYAKYRREAKRREGLL